MKVPLIILLSLAIGACAGTVSRAGPGKELEAVRDFVVASELPEVAKVRLYEQLSYFYVNDFFVIIPEQRGHHLIEFRGRCEELRRRRWTSDMIDFRVTARYLYANHDTIRGCTIGTIYELSEAQLEEMRHLGDAPGEEVFMTSEE